MTDGLSGEEVSRIVDAVEVIEDAVGRQAATQKEIDRQSYRDDPDTQAMVERRFFTGRGEVSSDR